MYPYLFMAAAIVIGVFILLSRRSLAERCTERTTATVIRYEREVRKKRYRYISIIEYYFRGDRYESRVGSSYRGVPYKKGKQFEILVNSSDGNEIFIPEVTKMRNVAFLFIGLGCAFMVLKIILAFR